MTANARKGKSCGKRWPRRLLIRSPLTLQRRADAKFRRQMHISRRLMSQSLLFWRRRWGATPSQTTSRTPTAAPSQPPVLVLVPRHPINSQLRYFALCSPTRLEIERQSRLHSLRPDWRPVPRASSEVLALVLVPFYQYVLSFEGGDVVRPLNFPARFFPSFFLSRWIPVFGRARC